jgi:hypothetical protein
MGMFIRMNQSMQKRGIRSYNLARLSLIPMALCLIVAGVLGFIGRLAVSDFGNAIIFFFFISFGTCILYVRFRLFRHKRTYFDHKE